MRGAASMIIGLRMRGTAGCVIASLLLAIVFFIASGSRAARAADLADDCCADLEERVAELEATTARKGNRKVSLTVYGQVHRALLAWDDGEASDAYVVDSSTWTSFFGFAGKGTIRPGLNAGFIIEVQMNDAVSGNVSQLDDEGPGGEGGLQISKALWYLENEKVGTLTVGTGSEASDLVTSSDLSGSDLIATPAVTDWNASFFLREAGIPGLPGIKNGLIWDDVLLNNAGDGADNHEIVRYDTPSFNGLILSASWGENDIWALAARYEGEWNSVKVNAAIGYTGYTDDDSPCIFLPDRTNKPGCNTLAGSVAFLHVPSGLNAAFAAGEIHNDLPRGFGFLDDDGSWYYTKIGLYRRFVPFGQTAFYAEYYHSDKPLFFDLPAGTTKLPVDVFAHHAEGDVWGFGIVQHWDALPMQNYISYRRYSADVDAFSDGGREKLDFDDFSALMVGSRIEF
jgi:predicted porin